MKIGLALSGGAALGAAHFGIFQALSEKNIKIDMLSGTSIGALIASFYAYGIDPEKSQELVSHLSWKDISSFKLSRLGLLSNQKIDAFLDKHLGDVKFEDSELPFAVVATDISSGQKVVLNKGDVGRAVMASMSIPGLYEPVEIDGKLLCDGGIVENIPISPLKKMGADKIIAVNLTSYKARNKPNNILEVILNGFQFRLITAIKLVANEADILIEPDLSKFNLVDTSQTDELKRIGYKEAIKILEETKIFDK